MNFNHLLADRNIDPTTVIVLRHRAHEPELNKVLPWLAEERPTLFNAYQQTQGPKLEKAMTSASYVASFLGHEPGKALLVGIYSIGETRTLTFEQFWSVPEYIELKAFGMTGWATNQGKNPCLWFDLQLTEDYADWKGRLVIRWPPPERSWWRRAHKNDFTVLSIHEENTLAARKPDWRDIVLTWEELKVLPRSWRSALAEWRGIYFIHDQSDGKGYVGSAYGGANILGRWEGYAKTGHGNNRLLRKRDPRDFKFSILERVSPDMEADLVIRRESGWKERLHTRDPFGLNDN